MRRKKIEELRFELDTLVKTFEIESAPCHARVEIHYFDTGECAGYRSHQPGWAASIIKVPVMTAVLEDIAEGRFSLKETILPKPEHMLETYDPVSCAKPGTRFSVERLLHHMIVASDNHATNALIERVGIRRVNAHMRRMGMQRTMLGHLLCPKVPRYTTLWNLDGSNLTTPADMNVILKHIFEPATSSLSAYTRAHAKRILLRTSETFPHKVGALYDLREGRDSHDSGVLDESIGITVMEHHYNWSSSRARELFGTPQHRAYRENLKRIKALRQQQGTRRSRAPTNERGLISGSARTYALDLTLAAYNSNRVEPETYLGWYFAKYASLLDDVKILAKTYAP